MVVEGNGNEGTVEGFDSAQTVLGMTNTVTDKLARRRTN